MFERIKKVFTQPDATPMQTVVPDAVSVWAGT